MLNEVSILDQISTKQDISGRTLNKKYTSGLNVEDTESYSPIKINSSSHKTLD